MNKGKIIILNGVSSSGKTTLSKALQNAFSEEYLALGIDDIIGMLPGGLPETGVKEAVRKCQNILHGFIRLLSDMGHNVIVDNLILASFGTLEECIACLRDYPVMLVRLNCPAHELRRREQKRGDRSIGNGESQIDELVPADTYDVVVNTYEESIEQCVNRILQLVDSPDEWTAMKQLGREMGLEF